MGRDLQPAARGSSPNGEGPGHPSNLEERKLLVEEEELGLKQLELELQQREVEVLEKRNRRDAWLEPLKALAIVLGVVLAAIYGPLRASQAPSDRERHTPAPIVVPSPPSLLPLEDLEAAPRRPHNPSAGRTPERPSSG